MTHIRDSQLPPAPPGGERSKLHLTASARRVREPCDGLLVPDLLTVSGDHGRSGWCRETGLGSTDEGSVSSLDGGGVCPGGGQISCCRAVMVFRARARSSGFSVPAPVPGSPTVVGSSLDSAKGGRVTRTRELRIVHGDGGASANALLRSTRGGESPSWLVELPAATER